MVKIIQQRVAAALEKDCPAAAADTAAGLEAVLQGKALLQEAQVASLQ